MSARKAWSALFGVLLLYVLALATDCASMALAEFRIGHENREVVR